MGTGSSPHPFRQGVNEKTTDKLTEDFWNITLPNEISTSSGRSPSLSGYYAALNLLDARVLFSKMKVSELLDPAVRAKKASIGRHHLFPKGFLAKVGITEIRDTNQIGNFALVEWSDNIDISDKSPAEYLPEYLKRFTDDELKEMYYSHALLDSWETLDYREFIERRRKLLAGVIKAGFLKLAMQAT